MLPILVRKFLVKHPELIYCVDGRFVLTNEQIKMGSIDMIEYAKHEAKDQISSEIRKQLRFWLKELKFEIIGHASWEQAIVTAGGISTKEIDPTTMESKLIKNLYFAGEIIDIDADTGGFNLQAAFSTGYLAGLSASRSS